MGKMPYLGAVTDADAIVYVGAFVFEKRHLVNWKLEIDKSEIELKAGRKSEIIK